MRERTFSVRIGGVMIGAMAAALAAADARAQGLDPLPLEDGLDVGGRVRAVYDSNLLRLDDGERAGPDRSKDDLVTTVTAVVRAQESPGLQRLYVDAEVGRTFYAENGFLDRTRVLADAGWDWRLGTRCDGRIQARFSQAQVDLAEQGGIVGNRQRNTLFAGGGGCEIGLGFRPAIEFRHRDSENRSPFRRGADFEVDTARVEFAYNRTGKTGVAAGYRSERFTYPNRIDLLTGRRLRVDRDAVGARLDADIAVRTSLSVFADHNWIEPEGRSDSFRRWSGGVSGTYRPIPRFRLRATAEREIDASFFVAASFVERDRAELAGAYAISPRTQLGLRGAVERNRYRDRQVAPGADLRSFDRLVLGEATAEYRVARNIDLALEARYQDRITDAAFGTFDGFRVAASLRIVL